MGVGVCADWIVLLTDVPEFIQFAEEHPQLFSFVVWMSNLYALGAHHTFVHAFWFDAYSIQR